MDKIQEVVPAQDQWFDVFAKTKKLLPGAVQLEAKIARELRFFSSLIHVN
jgi:hypothetical protein